MSIVEHILLNQDLDSANQKRFSSALVAAGGILELVDAAFHNLTRYSAHLSNYGV